MNIAVVGAGAVGLYYGSLLQRAGHEVRFLLRRDYDAITRSGLTVTSPRGDFHLEEIRGFRDPRDMGTVDLVLIALKAFANRHLVEMVRPLVGSATALFTVQNGLGNEELLADAFGGERVLGGVAMIGVTRGEPGVVNHMALGSIRLGEFRGGRSPRSEQLAATFSAAGVTCEAVADLRKIRWEKLVWNIPFNGLCALTGQTPGKLLANPATRSLVAEIMDEVIAGGNAQGLSEPISPEYRDEMLASTVQHTSDYRPSMMVDRLEGRPLELEAIYRIPLRYAAQQGVPMVRVGMLHALLDLGEPIQP
ncbi:2-dehydropantoate 2-reductase [Geobacter sp. FeAm09]|uniref:2-dehydropantoate 2-reductase n=1 Tax=Geobacter sp. FeAm09 TaxID=2597769 RepID=UPI0011EE4540|nr:2-dehydropantoate 2-reductase [Geobacter sp. FeAm09]QEM68729.1 2-dehydropantoate 2-reductase [Geobacter sp. FeAm09]